MHFRWTDGWIGQWPVDEDDACARLSLVSDYGLDSLPSSIAQVLGERSWPLGGFTAHYPITALHSSPGPSPSPSPFFEAAH